MSDESLFPLFDQYMENGGVMAENLNSESTNSEIRNLDQFHLIDDRGRVKGVFDYAIFQYLTTERDLFVLGGIPYVYENGCYHADENGSRLKTMIRACCYPEFIKSTTIKRVYDLFIMADELQVTYHDLNQYPAHWINFLNGFYDPVKRKLIPHDPAYKAVNQIPHEHRSQCSGSAAFTIVSSRFSASCRTLLFQIEYQINKPRVQIRQSKPMQ